MTEAIADPAVSSTMTGPSAGTLLRHAREASGLHVAALAVSLKVPVRKLEALEQDRLELVGDLVFVRGLASSVCRTLKVDAQPVLDRLPQGSRPRLVQDSDGINTPFRAPSDGAPPNWLDTLRKPVVLGVGALLVGAVVIMFMPQRAEKAAGGPAASPAAPSAIAALPTASLPAPEPVQFAPAPEMPVTPAPAGSAPIARAAQATPQQAVAVTPAPTPADAVPPGSVVVFRTTGDSWVEVVDAKGNVALRKLMAAGEAAGLDASPPFKVTVGKADVTRVQVRGKPFDLQPVSKDNVARFEVK